MVTHNTLEHSYPCSHHFLALQSVYKAMAQKPDSDLDKLFEGIEDASGARPAPTSTQDEHDLLAGLESLAAGHPKSRPHTPAHRSRTPLGRNSSDSYSGYGIPPQAIRRESSEVGTSTPLIREIKPTPPATDSTPPAAAPTAATTAAGWGWGSIWETATAAVKELQQSEEGKKWAQQVKQNAGALRGVVVPTFTTLLHTLAPPISSHEQLRIHITHDLVGYPFVDRVVYGVFDRVMQQVEGGDLMVVQKGGGRADTSGLGGPWYKEMRKRELNAAAGLQEGIKLAGVAAESFAREFLRADAAEEEPSKENPTRKSNIFLAIQPSIHSPDAVGKVEEGQVEDQVVSFAIHLFDPVHGLSFSTVSQALPAQWLEWLDAPPPAGTAPGEWAVPEVIRNIMDIGGIDPREWIVEWVEEAMGLAVGVVAQRYVAKRMRIGDSGSHGMKGKGVSTGGEEARAVAL